MSKKKLLNRLDNLFSELELENASSSLGGDLSHLANEQGVALLPAPAENLVESDQRHDRSSQIEPTTDPRKEKAGYQRRGKPPGYLVEDGRIVHATSELTPFGAESIQFQHLLYQNARGGDPAVVALPAPFEDGDSHLLVELVDDQPSRRWSEDELLLIEQVTDQLTLALENAQYFEQTQAQAEELNILRQVSLELAQEQRDLNTVLEIISRRAQELLESDGSSIWLWHDTEQELAQIVSHPPAPAEQPTRRIKLDEDLPGMAFSRRITQVIDDYPAWVEHAWINHRMLASVVMAVPLFWQNKGVGVLMVSRQQAGLVYTPNERHLAELLSAQAASVIQNAGLFEQTQTALQETETLYKASAELNASTTFDNILEILRRYTILGINTREVSLNLYDQPWSGSEMPEYCDRIAHWSMTPSNSEPHTRFSLNSIPSAAQLLRAKGSTIIEDIANNTSLGSDARDIFLNKYKAHSLIFAPLVTGGLWIGHISAIFHKPVQFSEAAVRRLNALTAQSAVAIQNLRLLGESRRRAEELHTAAEIARDSTGTLALNDLLSRAVSLIRERFNYYHTAIFLLDESASHAVVRASTGPAGEEMIARRHSLVVGSNSVIGYVTRVGEPLVVNDVAQDPIHRPNPLLPETRAELGIPLKIGDRVTGALDVQSNQVNAFTSADISVLQVLADQLAIAVENARAFEISVQAVEEMRKADQLKSQFLANMSHELRTPLNSIIGFSRVILKGIDGPVTEVQEQDLNAIYNSGQHLLSLINDILDLSKIEAGKMELSFEEHVGIADIIQSVVPTASGLVKDKAIELLLEIDDNLPSVRADPVKIRQVLLNLLSNAAKFTDTGSILIKASLRKNAWDKPEICIQVIDTGPGIALEDQGKLFLPFSQVDASPSRKTGGSGLGLSICRHLIDMHGGRIGVESEQGKGSNFYFILPASSIIETGKNMAGESTKGKLILCIDDEREVINLYQRYLADHGYQVIPLTDPTKAVQTASRVRPAAITLDINMPDQDGMQVLQALKDNTATKDIPVIICSIVDEHEKAFRWNAEGYLLKPILEDDLLGALHHVEESIQNS